MERSDLVTHLAHAILWPVLPEVAIADQLPACFQRDREREPLARLLALGIDKNLDERPDLFCGSIFPGIKAKVTRIALIFQHSRPIRLDILAQEQPFSRDLHALWNFAI
jgi:hypothetical protein